MKWVKLFEKFNEKESELIKNHRNILNKIWLHSYNQRTVMSHILSEVTIRHFSHLKS